MHVSIKKESLESKLKCNVELECEALFYSTHERKRTHNGGRYKPTYAVFMEYDEFPKDVPKHVILCGNNDEETHCFEERNIIVFHPSTYKAWEEWFLRPEADCTVHIKDGKILRGSITDLYNAGIDKLLP